MPCPCIISSTAPSLVTSSSTARSGRPKQSLHRALPRPASTSLRRNNNSRCNPRTQQPGHDQKPLQAQTIDHRPGPRPIHLHYRQLTARQDQKKRGCWAAHGEKSSCSSRAPRSFTHWHCSDFLDAGAGRKHQTNYSTSTSETDAWAIFDQTQRSDTSSASPSIGPVVIF
jgi:hypothetical protein